MLSDSCRRIFLLALCFALNTPVLARDEENTGRGPGGPPPVSPDMVLQADFDNGSTIYDNACSACHGEFGQGGQGGGPPLPGNLNLSEIMLVVNDGRNTMPAFDVLSDQELVDISTFVSERLQ